MRGSGRRVALILVALAAACGPRFRSTVRIVPEAPFPVTGGETLHPPDCGLPATPAYPPELEGLGLPLVEVRVDSLLSEEGTPTEVHGGTDAALEEAGAFVRAAEEAVARGRCFPAGRMLRPDEPPEFIPFPYRTWVTFRFDSERIGRRATMVPPAGDGAFPPERR